MVYMNYILSPAVTVDERLLKVRKILEAPRQADLTGHISRSKFLTTKFYYLGHEISQGKVRLGIDKVQAVHNLPNPTNQHSARLGSLSVTSVNQCNYSPTCWRKKSLVSGPTLRRVLNNLTHVENTYCHLSALQ